MVICGKWDSIAFLPVIERLEPNREFTGSFTIDSTLFTDPITNGEYRLVKTVYVEEAAETHHVSRFLYYKRIKEQAVVMLSLFERGPLNGVSKLSFRDVSIDHWAFKGVEAAVTHTYRLNK